VELSFHYVGVFCFCLPSSLSSFFLFCTNDFRNLFSFYRYTTIVPYLLPSLLELCYLLRNYLQSFKQPIIQYKCQNYGQDLVNDSSLKRHMCHRSFSPNWNRNVITILNTKSASAKVSDGWFCQFGSQMTRGLG